MIKITLDEIRLISNFIHEQCGIVLDDSKGYLIESRFAELMEEFACTSYRQLCQLARNASDRVLLNRMIDAISTNETSFFRDRKPFELFKYKILPDLLDRKYAAGKDSRPIKIWSAACSTGQEVYTVAITVLDLLGKDAFKHRIQIVGTDISDAAIVKASRGVYSQLEVERGLPESFKGRYFTPERQNYRVNDELRALVYFKKINLMQPLSSLDQFDVIFCRNVAIYFNLANRKILFNRLADQLKPQGFLLIGSTESLYGISDRFIRKEYHNTAFYQTG